MGLFTPLKSFFKKENKNRKTEKEEKRKKESKNSNSNSKANYNDRSQQVVLESSEIEDKVTRETIWEMNKKLDELLEIKELYEDMLDWMVEMNQKEDVEKDRDPSKSVSTESSKVSNLSPRLRQILEIVREKGEVDSSDLSEELDLSRNRCSELLNVLFKSNYLSKKRVGRKVYYRYNSSEGEVLEH